MNEKIATKFGTAKINKEGYYKITSKKEGNNGKLLHRLIYESAYGVSLLPTSHIHHIDGNRINNDISNLQPMDKWSHAKLHASGENNPMYGRKHSKETIELIRQKNSGKNAPMYGKHHSDESRKKMRENHADFKKEKNPFYGKHHSKENLLKRSSSLTKTGIFRVHILKCKSCKDGTIFKYKYYDENHKRCAIASTSLSKLKEKVLAKGLPWIKLEEEEFDES